MPDILVRHIDEATAERIKAIARERGWSINEVILHALRHGVGSGGEDMRRELPETAAFRSAVDAFERVDGKPLYEDGIDAGQPK